MSENLSHEKLKVGEVAKLIGETEHIIRNWIRDFRDHVPLEKGDNGYNLFTQESIQVLQTIKQLNRERGYSTKQIRMHFLNHHHQEKTVVVPEEDLKQIKDMLSQQRDFNQALIQRMDDQQKYIESSLQVRDRQLMQTIRALQDSKQTKKWWRFWK